MPPELLQKGKGVSLSFSLGDSGSSSPVLAEVANVFNLAFPAGIVLVPLERLVARSLYRLLLGLLVLDADVGCEQEEQDLEDTSALVRSP